MDKDLAAGIALIALEIGIFVLPIFPRTEIKNPETVVAHQSPHWGYEGTVGPQYWGDISEEYKTCSIGDSQTPIDIFTASTKKITTQDFTFSYKTSPLTVVNNGHTIQVTYAPGSYVTYNGLSYELAQFHFHVPSEHTINGKAWPMNVHLVHKNKEGELLVVEVLFDEGKVNEELAKIINVMPKTEGTMSRDDILVDASKLLPDNISHYHYDGSLTTPPCTEGVNWFVMKSPIQVAKTDVDQFKTLFPHNARPVLPVNGRVIEEL